MQRISWIGVGIMGKAMVRNLMKAGYEVHIYARHPEKVADVVSEGAVPHGSIAECVKASEVVITMVGFPKDVEEVYFAPGNILDSAAKGMTLYDALQALYKKYGWYGEKTHNLVMPGLEGMALMAKLMAKLRQTPPTEIAGTMVLRQKDYQDGTERDTASGAVSPMALVGSNVLAYDLADGTTFIIRPSGTEPKIKVYVLAHGGSQAECDEKLAKYTAFADVIKTMA